MSRVLGKSQFGHLPALAFSFYDPLLMKVLERHGLRGVSAGSDPVRTLDWMARGLPLGL